MPAFNSNGGVARDKSPLATKGRFRRGAPAPAPPEKQKTESSLILFNNNPTTSKNTIVESFDFCIE